jgi:hypothetical protein
MIRLTREAGAHYRDRIYFLILNLAAAIPQLAIQTTTSPPVHARRVPRSQPEGRLPA